MITIFTWNSSYTFLSKNKNKTNKPDNKSDFFFRQLPFTKIKRPRVIPNTNQI